MYIEKKFHTEAVLEMQRIKREIEEEEAAMTDEERAKQAAENEAEADAIIQSVEEKRRNSYQVINGERLKWFTRLSDCVLQMAEITMLDVVIKTEGTHGKIELRTDYLVLNESCPSDVGETFAVLIKTADDLYMKADGEDVVIECFFNLVDEISKG